MVEDVQRSRGSVIKGYLKFIKRKWGDDGLESVARDCGFKVKDIHENSWYDYEFDFSIRNWIATNKGIEYLERCGNHTVKDLGLLSYIVKFGRIEKLLERLPNHFSHAFARGSVDVHIDSEAKKAVIEMRNAASDDYSCKSWIGAIRGMLEMTNTPGTVEETECCRAGSEACMWDVKW